MKSSNVTKNSLWSWLGSDAHLQMHAQFHRECERVLNLGEQQFNNIQIVQEQMASEAYRFEACVNGGFHRGAYFPGMLSDLMIGNRRKGYILKKETEKSNPSHRYCFDKYGAMLFIQQMICGELECTEYLIRSGDRVLGIAVTPEGELASISEEQYRDGKLMKYAYAEIAPQPREKEIYCYNFRLEKYYYDEQGLYSGEWVNFQPAMWPFKYHTLIFERENGYLTAYTSIDNVMEMADPLHKYREKYTIRDKRKA